MLELMPLGLGNSVLWEAAQRRELRKQHPSTCPLDVSSTLQLQQSNRKLPKATALPPQGSLLFSPHTSLLENQSHK